ncbi:MAG: hypothetical protein AAF937_12935 [Planctomycetota bacterium]
MPGSFGGVDLFGSGPHRFQEGRSGYLVLPQDFGGTPSTQNASFGEFQLWVHVRGRLVAASDAALWALRDAIAVSLDVNGAESDAADLVDEQGRTWTGMRFVRIEWAEEVDRGRRVSVGYEARFLRYGS